MMTGTEMTTNATSTPARLLRLSLGQWLVGLAGHQRRHNWQAQQAKRTVLGDF